MELSYTSSKKQIPKEDQIKSIQNINRSFIKSQKEIRVLSVPKYIEKNKRTLIFLQNRSTNIMLPPLNIAERVVPIIQIKEQEIFQRNLNLIEDKNKESLHPSPIFFQVEGSERPISLLNKEDYEFKNQYAESSELPTPTFNNSFMFNNRDFKSKVDRDDVNKSSEALELSDVYKHGCIKDKKDLISIRPRRVNKSNKIPLNKIKVLNHRLPKVFNIKATHYT